MELHSGTQLLELMRGYQIPCLLAAAADLEVFESLDTAPRTASAVAAATGCDPRAVTMLLDALAAVGIVTKVDQQYALAPSTAPWLQSSSPDSVLPMLRHQANCLRRWTRLAWTIRSGALQPSDPSVRGEDADEASFIEAMHVVSRGVAQSLVDEIHPGGVQCVLDIGGASGTWTLAWLTAEPAARAIIFDLPHVIPLARARLAGTPWAERIELVEGDFERDDLPRGADLAWVSAILHQNSPQQNRALFERVAAALRPSGWIYIRDMVLEPSRTRPVAAALFAINMLSATEGGNCYTLDEMRDGLESAGFTDVEQVRHDQGMHSIVRARLA